MRRVLVLPGISLGSAVWWLGGVAIVPLFTILSGVLFWTLATIGFLAFRTLRRRGRRDDEVEIPESDEPRTSEETVRSRVESLS